VPLISLGPHHLIGFSGSTRRRLPVIGRGRPLRRFTQKVSPLLLFGTLRMKMSNRVSLRTKKAREIGYGKIWRTLVTAKAKTTKPRMVRYQPIPCTKSLARNEIVHHIFVETYNSNETRTFIPPAVFAKARSGHGEGRYVYSGSHMCCHRVLGPSLASREGAALPPHLFRAYPRWWG
jgi:hypothetical protein